MRLSSGILVALLSAAMALSGCATRSVDVVPEPANPADFDDWTCEAIFDETYKVQRRAADVAYAVDAQLGNNVIAIGLGVTVFWPALLAMRPDGPEAAELARLKGRYEALRKAALVRPCGEMPDTPTPAQLQDMPLVVGERLVYEERLGPRGAPSEMGLRLKAIRRGQLEFSLDVAGQPVNLSWVQDASGNIMPMPPGPTPLHWVRLLPVELGLGDVVTGEMRGAGGGLARVRGQVIARGVRTLIDRPFDAAVIELYGDVLGDSSGSRIDGVMVIDRHSGVLLRLELRSPHPDFAVRRTLLRVEPPG